MAMRVRKDVGSALRAPRHRAKHAGRPLVRWLDDLPSIFLDFPYFWHGKSFFFLLVLAAAHAASFEICGEEEK